MKKLVLAAIMMLVPFSAFALDSMSDKALDKMTAQEGVTITFDNVVVTQQASDMAWHDNDGIAGATTAGRIYIAQSGNTTTTITGDLTIDVATAGTGGLVVGPTTIASGVSFVKIGLPSVSQAAAAKTMTISMDNATASTVGSTGTALGTLFQNGGNSSISGAVYIYAH